MTSADNIKLAIQAAWAVNESALALTLALREFSLRGLCLQCASGTRRITHGRDGRVFIWLICRQCQHENGDKKMQNVPTCHVSIYVPPAPAIPYTINSIWFDTTEMQVYVRAKAGWRPTHDSDELFERLGVEPEQIYATLSSFASAVEHEDDE